MRENLSCICKKGAMSRVGSQLFDWPIVVDDDRGKCSILKISSTVSFFDHYQQYLLPVPSIDANWSWKCSFVLGDNLRRVQRHERYREEPRYHMFPSSIQCRPMVVVGRKNFPLSTISCTSMSSSLTSGAFLVDLIHNRMEAILPRKPTIPSHLNYRVDT